MDAGDILLICLVSLLVLTIFTAWWCTGPLMMCMTRHASWWHRRQRTVAHQQMDWEQDSPAHSQRSNQTGRSSLMSWRQFVRPRAAPANLGQEGTSLDTLPVRNNSSNSIPNNTFNESSILTTADAAEQLREPPAMTTVPPLPARSLKRRTTDLGTQVSCLPALKQQTRLTLAGTSSSVVGATK